MEQAENIEMPQEPTFKGQVRIITFNTDGLKDGSAFVSQRINELQPNIAVLQQIGQKDAEDVQYRCGFKNISFCDDHSGGLALLTNFQLTSSDSVELCDSIQTLRSQVLVGKTEYSFFTLDLSNVQSEPKRASIDKIQELVMKTPNSIQIGCLNCELKSDLITLMKLERIQKDGDGHTFNNEEFDYVHVVKEDFTVLRHYVVQNAQWKKDRHKMVLMDCLLK